MHMNIKAASFSCRYHGFQCRCIQEPIDCVPEDGYDVTMTCDNTEGAVDAECAYTKTIGTSFEEEVENNMGIDATIEAELRAQFYGVFGAALGVSHVTGYDWNQISTAAQSEVESFEVNKS